jgi:hypothetical protein
VDFNRLKIHLQFPPYPISLILGGLINSCDHLAKCSLAGPRGRCGLGRDRPQFDFWPARRMLLWT